MFLIYSSIVLSTYLVILIIYYQHEYSLIDLWMWYEILVWVCWLFIEWTFVCERLTSYPRKGQMGPIHMKSYRERYLSRTGLGSRLPGRFGKTWFTFIPNGVSRRWNIWRPLSDGVWGQLINCKIWYWVHEQGEHPYRPLGVSVSK